MKKLIQKLSVGICMLSISTAASFASIAAEITQDDLAKTPATEATIEQPEMDVLQHVSSELQNSFVNGDAKEPLKLIEEFTSSVDNETLDSAKERGTPTLRCVRILRSRQFIRTTAPQGAPLSEKPFSRC